MLGLPKTTEFNKRIPKQKFYENITITPALKRVFIEQIKTIYWRNKVAATTTNLAPGEKVNEVEFIEVKLNAAPLDEAVLRQIDKEIPYHIIFLLEYEGKYQACTSYKEASSGNASYNVGVYYRTDWLPENELPLHIDGLDVDIVYENFVRQIAGEVLQKKTSDESLAESVAKDKMCKALNKQIEYLQSKIRKEKQLNKQVVMSASLKKLKEELERMQ